MEYRLHLLGSLVEIAHLEGPCVTFSSWSGVGTTYYLNDRSESDRMRAKDASKLVEVALQASESLESLSAYRFHKGLPRSTSRPAGLLVLCRRVRLVFLDACS